MGIGYAVELWEERKRNQIQLLSAPQVCKMNVGLPASLAATSGTVRAVPYSKPFAS